MTEIKGYVRYGSKARWFDLPVSSQQVAEKLKISEEAAESAGVTALDGDLKYGRYFVVSLAKANNIAEKIQDIPAILLKNVSLIISTYFDDLDDFLENYDNLVILQGCSDEREVGNLLYQGRDFTDEEISQYFDFERLARDDMQEFNGMFLDGAYIHQNQ